MQTQVNPELSDVIADAKIARDPPDQLASQLCALGAAIKILVHVVQPADYHRDEIYRLLNMATGE